MLNLASNGEVQLNSIHALSPKELLSGCYGPGVYKIDKNLKAW